jgi:hypothetical protein
MIIEEGQSEEGAVVRPWNHRQNKESDMDFAEHRRIVYDALCRLLPGMPKTHKTFAQGKLVELADAYNMNDEDDVLYISKGIHQPGSNPHMQLKLKRIQDGKEKWYGGVHLNVSAVDPGKDVPSSLSNREKKRLNDEGYFHWVGVQFTADADGSPRAFWPKGDPARDMKNQATRRRMSIAPKDLQDKIDEINRAQRANQEAQKH